MQNNEQDDPDFQSVLDSVKLFHEQSAQKNLIAMGHGDAPQDEEHSGWKNDINKQVVQSNLLYSDLTKNSLTDMANVASQMAGNAARSFVGASVGGEHSAPYNLLSQGLGWAARTTGDLAPHLLNDIEQVIPRPPQGEWGALPTGQIIPPFKGELPKLPEHPVEELGKALNMPSLTGEVSPLQKAIEAGNRAPQPTTGLGRATENIGSLAPFFLGGEAGLPTKLAEMFAAGTGSEAARGQIDKLGGSKEAQEIASMIGMIGAGGATHAMLKEGFVNPPLNPEVARGVNNGIFEPSDPSIKVEAAQQMEARNPVNYGEAIAASKQVAYGKYDRWLRESAQRIKEGEKPAEPPAAEEGEPETDIHKIARSLEPDTFKQYDDLIAQRQWYADTMREQAEKRPVVEPDAEKMKALDGQVAPLQEKIDATLSKVNGIEDRLTKNKAAMVADARKQIDDLRAQQDALRAEAEKASKGETPDMAALRKKYEAIGKQLSDVAATGKIRKAYERAQKFLPDRHEVVTEEEAATPAQAHTAETPAAIPEAVPAPTKQNALPLPKPTMDIAGDVEKRAIEAGYAPDVAKEIAAIHASFFDTLAKVYPEIGNATELYNKYGADIRGGRGAAKGAELGQTDIANPAFKKWFGNSKVVDKEGKPLVVYHGSPNDFNEFKSEFIGAHGTQEGQGFYFTDNPDVARGYAEKGKLYEAYLKIEKPLDFSKITLSEKDLTKFIKAIDPDGSGYLSNYGDVSYEGYNKVLKEAVKNELNGSDNDVDIIHSLFNASGKNFNAFFTKLKEVLGYDGSIHRNPQWGNQTIYLPYDNTAIKSIHNEGTFDPNNPNILKQTTRGKIALATEGTRAVITLMKSADASTFLHESGHLFLDVLDRISKEEGAPDRIKADVAAARKWMGIPDDADLRALDAKGRYKYRTGLERFARGFERYLMEGTAPSPEMAGVFAKFKTWLTDIYKSVTALKVGLSPEIRDVFDRMLAVNPKRTIITPEREIPQEGTGTFNIESPKPKAKSENVEPTVPISEAASPILKAKEPMRLVDYIKKLGGVNDEGGDLAAMIGDKKDAKKIINEKGMKIDDLVEKAWKDGYFPEFKNRPTIEDFKERLDHDLRGKAQYSHNDIADVQKYHDVQAHNEEVNRVSDELGISIIGKSYNEFWNEVAEKRSTQEQEQFILEKEAAAKKALEEAEAAREEHFADVGHKYETEEPTIRSLEDLEHEWKQEELARNMEQGTATGAEQQPTAGRETAIQPSGGAGGIGIESTGRTGAGDAESGENAGSTKRPATYLDKEGNIRPELLTDDTAILQAIQEAVDAEKKVNPAAFQHESVSRAKTRWLAENLGQDAQEVLDNVHKFTHDNTEISTYVDKMKLLIEGQAKQVMDASAKHADFPSPENMQSMLDEQARLRMILQTYSDVTNISGRLLGTFRKSSIEQERAKILNELYQQAGSNPQRQAALAQKISSTIQELPQESVVKYVRESSGGKFAHSLVELSNASILSGVLSHKANMIVSFARVPLIPVEAILKAVRNEVGMRVFGKEDTGARAGTALNSIGRLVYNIPTIISRAGTAFAEGKTVLLPMEKEADIDLGFEILKKTYGIDMAKIVEDVKSSFAESNHPELAKIKDTKQKASAINEIQSRELNDKIAQIASQRRTLRDNMTQFIDFTNHVFAAAKTSMADMKTAKWFGVEGENALPDFRIAKIPVPVGSFITGTTARLFSVPHTVLRDVAYFLRLDEAANSVAASEGYKADMVRERAKQLIEGLDERTFAIARREANYYSMLGDDNATAKRMVRIREALDFPYAPIGSLIMPVISIPMRAIHQGLIDYSPAGLLSGEKFNEFRGIVKINEETHPELKALREKIANTEDPINQRLLETKYEMMLRDLLDEKEKGAAAAMETAQVRLFVGTALGAVSLYLLHNGLMTPPPSVDYKINDTRTQDNAPPSSILINGTWLPINKIPGLGTILGIYNGLASMSGVGEYNYKESEIKRLVGILDNTLLAENPLSSLRDLMNAVTMEKGEKSSDNYVGNFVASRIVPNLVTQFVREGDTQKATHDLWENIESRLPFAADSLQPRINPYTGEPTIRHRTHEYSPNTNIDELVKMGYNGISNPKPIIHGVPLLPKEETEYNIIHGHLMANAMDYLFKGDGAQDYQSASLERKRQMFDRIRSFVSKASQSILLSKNPNLLQRINDHIDSMPEDIKKPEVNTPYSSEDEVNYH